MTWSIPIPDWTPQTWGVLLATTLGLGNLGWNVFNALKSRRLSVDDDFWFRKILAPFVLEKSLEFAGTWCPQIANLAASKPGAITQQLQAFKDAKSSLVENFICVKLFSDSAHVTICNRLDEIDDEVTLLCHSLTSSINKSATKAETCKATAMNVRAEIFGLLSDVRKLHKTIR